MKKLFAINERHLIAESKMMRESREIQNWFRFSTYFVIELKEKKQTLDIIVKKIPKRLAFHHHLVDY